MLDLPTPLKDLVTRERGAVTDLLVLLAKLEAEPEAVANVRTAVNDLDGIFLLVVAGEFNAGKSSLINALLGERVMPEGVTPTTDRVTVITHGAEVGEKDDGKDVVRRTYPSELLDTVAFVDTPGTNAIVARHQQLTERFVPRADLVLFVTSADRPFTQSEREFLELIASWGKKVLMVVNKIDILASAAERETVLEFVAQHARETLGSTPEVFGVSARAAFQARQAGNEAALAATGVPELEAAIRQRLGPDRLKLKLLTPLGVAKHTADHHLEVLHNRLELLNDDSSTLAEIERQRAHFESEMKRDLKKYVDSLKGVLSEVEQRGEEFFDDTIRWRRIAKLMNSQKVKEEFEAKVVKSAEAEIDAGLSELVDWFISRNIHLWEDVMSYLNEKRAAEQERVIGEVGGRFQYDRQALLRGLRERAETALVEYDAPAAARQFADRLQGAVIQTGLLEVGGLGLSAAMLAIMTGAALDITGLAIGLTAMGLGLLVFPRQRARAKRELRRQMEELQAAIDEGVGKQFALELDRSQEKLTGAISPYTRFVGTELKRLHELQLDLEEVTGRLAALRREVEASA
ncbi:MAG TPA: dynamin family protein [Trueperaceae bacterium]|nr:dynamin family protein [Trueperaceae bacterium]